MKKPIFIAEIKTKSPFGYESPYTFSTLMDEAIQHGDWISVHTNALWGGDLDAIGLVRKYTNKPILAKGIHATTDSVLKAFDAGAQYVLTTNDNLGTASSPREDWFKLDAYKDNILFETEYDRVLRDTGFNSCFKTRKYVCNLRDLRQGMFKPRNELNDFLRLGVWTCQASGIRKPEDVVAGVEAFLVGEHLVDFIRRKENET